MTSPRALYLYAVVPRGVELVDVSGIGDERVELVFGARLGLLVSDVDVTLLSEVNDPKAAQSLGELARRHDSVVREAAARSSGVLPFRLGTVVPGREAALRLLADRAEVLEPALRRVDACWEWGVTALFARGTGRPQAPAAAPTGTGAAYLARRREELAEIEALRRCRAVAGAEVEAELREKAVDATSSAAGNALLRSSYLVRRESEPAFFHAIDRCGDRLEELGLRLELSGPWPPYSFVPARALEVGRE